MTFRRTVTVTIAAAVLAVTGATVAVTPPSPQAAPVGTLPARQPNVLLILTDDQRAGTHVGMPHVANELAANGVTFTNAFVPTSWCCPSRASLLSGKLAHNNGVWENSTGSAWGAWAAFARGGEEADTLATRLDTAGYRTGLFGKYLNDTDRAGRGFTPPGWDDWHAFIGGGYTRYRLSSDPEPVRGERRYLTDELADRTLDFITSTPEGTPFFAYFSPFAPHYPYDAGPYSGATRAAGLLDDIVAATGYPSPATDQAHMAGYPRWMRDLPRGTQWRQDGKRNPVTGLDLDTVIEQQADTLWGVDQAIGRLLDTLENDGRLADTIVVFVSDNGYAWGEHRLQGKNTPHDVSVRVPLLMRYDRGLPAGAVDDRVVAANIDVHATILDLAGVPAGDIDGVSVRDAARSGVVMEAMPWDKHKRPAYCGWRTRDALYVRYATGEEELYDYTSDPHELDNLADDPAWREQRSRLAQAARAACSPAPPGFTWGAKQPRVAPPTDVTGTWAGSSALQITWRASATSGTRMPVYVVTARTGAQGASGREKPVCTLPSTRLARGLTCTVTVTGGTVTVTVKAVVGRSTAAAEPVRFTRDTSARQR